jgi:hypothetical protein
MRCACSAILLQENIAAEAAPIIQAFVSAGGGLLTGAQAWFWAYTSPIEQHPLNVLLAPMGIMTSPDVTSADCTFTSTPPSQLGNAELALTCLAATYQGDTTSHYLLDSSQQVATATQSVIGAARVLPLTGSFWAKLQQVRRLALLWPCRPTRPDPGGRHRPQPCHLARPWPRAPAEHRSEVSTGMQPPLLPCPPRRSLPTRPPPPPASTPPSPSSATRWTAWLPACAPSSTSACPLSSSPAPPTRSTSQACRPPAPSPWARCPSL